MIDKTDIFGDGRAIIFRNKVRGEVNPVWQAYITTSGATGRVRKSTGAKDKNRAEQITRDFLVKAEGRIEAGLPLNPIRFKRASELYINYLKLQQELGKTTLNNIERQKAIIEQAITPFFNKKYLHKISSSDIDNYHHQRTTLGATLTGRKASPNTINRDNAYIRGIFKYFKKEGYLSNIPIIENVSGTKRRASFTRGEMKKLQRKLKEWINSVNIYDAPHVIDYRRLFSLYINIIQYSGIRPGKEMASLRWADVSYKKTKGEEYVKLVCFTYKQKKNMDKTRSVIALPQLKGHLEHIENYENCYNPYGYIFEHPRTTQLKKKFIGTPIKSFKAQWSQFLAFSGLAIEKGPKERKRTLYSVRHYYFEQRLIHSDVSLNALAINGGTSPKGILDWYQESQSEQFASSLSRIIQQENN